MSCGSGSFWFLTSGGDDDPPSSIFSFLVLSFVTFFKDWNFFGIILSYLGVLFKTANPTTSSLISSLSR